MVIIDGIKKVINTFKNKNVAPSPEAVENIEQNEKYVDEIYQGRLGGVLSEMTLLTTDNDVKMRIKMLKTIYEQDLELTQLRAVNSAKEQFQNDRMLKLADLEKQLLALKDVK